MFVVRWVFIVTDRRVMTIEDEVRGLGMEDACETALEYVVDSGHLDEDEKILSVGLELKVVEDE